MINIDYSLDNPQGNYTKEETFCQTQLYPVNIVTFIIFLMEFSYAYKSHDVRPPNTFH